MKLQDTDKQTSANRRSAGTADRLYRFLLAGGDIRGVVISATGLINEMRARHDLGILETLVLGRSFLGVALMSADLKGRDRVALGIDCSGPIRGLLVEANADGEIRGYLKQVPIPIKRPMENADLSEFFGAGILSVTRHPRDAKSPFTGQVILKYGNLALDLANYYLESEQIPTAFRLGIDFDAGGKVAGAGALLLQAMPAAENSVVDALEAHVTGLPAIGAAFRRQSPPEWIAHHFQSFAPKVTGNRKVKYRCPCNRQRLRRLLLMLPPEELEDIRRNGPIPLEVRCHYCNTLYAFDRGAIDELYRLRYPRN